MLGCPRHAGPAPPVHCAPPPRLAATAGDYVPDFVRAAPGSHVVGLRWSARPAPRDGPVDGPVLTGAVVIRAAVRAVLSGERGIRVLAGGEVVGVVGAPEILAVIAS